MIPLLRLALASRAEEPMAMGLDDFIKKVKIEPHEIDALVADPLDDTEVDEAVQTLFDRKGGGLLSLKPTPSAEKPLQAEHIIDGFKRDAARVIRPEAFEVLGKGRLPKLRQPRAVAPRSDEPSAAPSAAPPPTPPPSSAPSSSPVAHSPMASPPDPLKGEGGAWTDTAGEVFEPYDPELADYFKRSGLKSPWPQDMVDEYWSHISSTSAPTESPAQFIIEAMDGVLDHWNIADWTVVDSPSHNDGGSHPPRRGGDSQDDARETSLDDSSTTEEPTEPPTVGHIDWVHQAKCTNVSEQPWMGGQVYDDLYAKEYGNDAEYGTDMVTDFDGNESHIDFDENSNAGRGHYADGFGLDGRLVDLNGFYAAARPANFLFWELCIPFDEFGNTVPMDFWYNVELPNTNFALNSTTLPSPTSPIDTNKTITWQAGGVDDDPWPARDVAAGEVKGIRKEYAYRKNGSDYFVGFEDLQDHHAEFEYDSYGPIQRPLKIREELQAKLDASETKHDWRVAKAKALGRDAEEEAKLSEKEVWDRFHQNKERQAAVQSSGQEWASLAKAFIRVKHGERTMTRKASELFEPGEIKGIMDGTTNFWDTIKEKSDPLYYAGPDADAMYQKAKIPKSLYKEDQDPVAFKQNLRSKMNQLANYNLNPGLAGNESEVIST